MPSERERVPILYWDANVLLRMLEGDDDSVGTIQAIVADCMNRKTRIVTSALSIAEVVYSKAEADGALSDDFEKALKELWSPGSPIEIADYNAAIGFMAVKLMRTALLSRSGGHPQEKWSLKPNDAIHLATATEMMTDEFHTYDERLVKFAKLVPFSVKKPYTNQLPLPPGESKGRNKGE